MTLTAPDELLRPPEGGSYADWLTFMESADATADLIDGIFDPFGTVVVGQPFAGKTWLALNVAAALATGRKLFLGRDVRRGCHRVVYIGTDPGSRHVAAERLRAMGVPGEAPIRLDRLPARADDSDTWALTVRQWERERVSAVILDNLLGATPENGDMNQTDTAGPLLRRLASVADAGIAVMAIAHPAKGGGATPLGSVAFDAFFRRRLFMGGSALAITSNNGHPMVLHYRRMDDGWLEVGEPKQRLQRNREPAVFNMADGDLTQFLAASSGASPTELGKRLHRIGKAKSAEAGRKQVERALATRKVSQTPGGDWHLGPPSES